MNISILQLQLTARAYHRVLKLSRTIADLAGSEVITQVHLRGSAAVPAEAGVDVDFLVPYFADGSDR